MRQRKQHPATDRIRSSGSRSLLPTGLSLPYDDAGRLTADETRGISSVAYNNDGLPTRVTFDDGARHTYIYDGLGRLVEAVYEYDYLARRYAPEFVHFTTPDPHAENTPWLSPYTPFAANPILHIDPSGMEFTKAAKEISDNLVSETFLRISLSMTETDISGYVATLYEIDEMQRSTQLFDVTIQHEDPNLGNTKYDLDKNAVVFLLPEGENQMSLAAHEFKHGHQFLTGETDLAIEGADQEGALLFYDIYDEKAAFARGELFGGDHHSLKDIMALKGSLYKKILYTPTNCFNKSGFPSYNINYEGRTSLENQRHKMANIHNRAFRIDNKKYLPVR